MISCQQLGKLGKRHAGIICLVFQVFYFKLLQNKVKIEN